MPIQLTYQSDSTLPVEVAGLTPAWALGKSIDEISALEILQGNRRIALGKLFEASGEADSLRLDFHGDLSHVHRLGAELDSGEIHVHGNVGRHLGAQMSGGSLHVSGDTSDWLGAEMRGGLIHVQGNAGSQVGAAYRGSPKGMTHGTILVEGNVGDEIGLAMRRALIAIGGSAGSLVGRNMLAGTVLVFGECGLRPGAGMKRGTIGMFGSSAPQLLPTFRRGCRVHPQVIPLLLTELRKYPFAAAERLSDGHLFDQYHGDLLESGRGEIFVTCGN